MLLRKLMEKLRKKLNRARVLAVAFLVLIFYVGSYTFPATMSDIGMGFVGDADIRAAAEHIDDNYRNMLGYDKSNLRNKGAYINLNGLMARLMGQREMNERIKLDNGHLTPLFSERDVSLFTLAATQITKLYKAQREKGKDFLFVLGPGKLPKYEDILPVGYESYSNENGDRLIEALKLNGVPALDLREKMHEDGIGNTEAFFVTDHHWKPETAFWAHTKILEYFEENGISGPIDEKYTDIENYNVEVREDWFLGSDGKRTGSYYAGVDDFSVIYPKFDTEVKLAIPSLGIDKTGAFRDVVFSGEQDSFGYFTKNPHGGYGYGRQAFKSYRNEDAQMDLRVMVMGDSFLPPVDTFLSLSVQSLDELDMSQYDGNFAEYYSEYAPDVVIVFVNINGVTNLNATYDYFGDLDAG